MSRGIGIFLSALVLLIVTGRAATFKIPEDKPVVAITFPDAWKPQKIEKGVQGQTADEAVYLAAELARTEQGMNTIIDEMFKLLREQKVSLDHDSKKEDKYQLDGFAADETRYAGQGPEGPVIVKVIFLSVSKDAVLVLTYWASPKTAKEYDKETKSILQSIKTVK